LVWISIPHCGADRPRLRTSFPAPPPRRAPWRAASNSSRESHMPSASFRRLRPTAAIALSFVALSFALPLRLHAQITAAEYAARRDSLAARIDSGIVVAFGARNPITDFGPFFQIPGFRYLTGYLEPDAALV